MCPPVLDHTITILVLDAQHCYHCAYNAEQGWKDVLHPQVPCDCHFFLSVQMSLSVHLH
jgi:hypothetical protein